MTSSEDSEADAQEDSTSNLKLILKVNDFVTVLYNGVEFPGLIKELKTDGPVVDCMEKGRNYWKWPERKDMMEYKWEAIKKIIVPPRLIKRGYFRVRELEMFT